MFPTYNVPDGNTYRYVDSGTGRTWVHDSNAWTPQAATKISDLTDVFTVPNTQGSLTTYNVVPRIQTTATALTVSNTRDKNVMFEAVLGVDARIYSIKIGGLYKDSTLTSGYYDTRFIKKDLGALGAKPGVVSNTEFDTYFNTYIDSSRGFSANQLTTDGANQITFSVYSNYYSLNTTVKAGEPFWIGVRSNYTNDGEMYYDNVAGTGIEVNAYPLTGGPLDYSKLEWNKNGNSDETYRWTSDRPDHAAPWNLITRQTTDPTPADLSAHQTGTYWVNTTTNRVWVHATTNGGFENDTSDAKWIQFPVYNEHKVKPAVAQVRNSETDPYIVPALAGEFMVDTSTNQLKLYDGASWIVL